MQSPHDRPASECSFDPRAAHARLVRPMLSLETPSRRVRDVAPSRSVRVSTAALNQPVAYTTAEKRNAFRQMSSRAGVGTRVFSTETGTSSTDIETSRSSNAVGSTANADETPVAKTDGVALSSARDSCTVHCNGSNSTIEATGCRTVLDVKAQVAMQLQVFVAQVELRSAARAGTQLRDDEKPPPRASVTVTESLTRASSISDWKHILRVHAQVGDLRGLRAACDCMRGGRSSTSSTVRDRSRVSRVTSDVRRTAEETPHGVVLMEVAFGELNADASDPCGAQQQVNAIRSLCAVDLSLAPVARDADGYSLLHRATARRPIPCSVVDVLLACKADVESLTPRGWFPLAFAAQSVCAEACLTLLQAHADVNRRHPVDSWTSLMLAAHRGHVSVVQTLLTHGANSKLQDSEEWTALHFAAQKGHADVAKALLAAGASVDLVTDKVSTPLQMAARKGHADVCALLVTHGASLEFVNSQGQTALSYAVWEGHVACVSLLVDARVDVNLRSRSLFSPLGLAAWRGFQAISSCLIAAGALINQENGDGVTPLLLAVQHHNLEVGACLLDAKADIQAEAHDKRTPWSVACAEGHEDMIRLLASHFGERLNESTDGGPTKLLEAIHARQDTVVGALLACKADARVSSPDGWFPLAVAAEYGFLNIVDLLLESDQCDVNQRSPEGWSALFPAVQNGHESVVSSLIAHRAAVDECDSEGWFPLAFAARSGRANIVESLLENRASIDARSGPHTALILAAQRGHTDVLALLLSKSANVNMKSDSGGQTALHLAAWEGHASVVDQLLSAMADVGASTNSGATPLDLASHRRNAPVICALVEHKASVAGGGNIRISIEETADVAHQREHEHIPATLKSARREEDAELRVEIDAANTISTLTDMESPVAVAARTSARANIGHATADGRLEPGSESAGENARIEKLVVLPAGKSVVTFTGSTSVAPKGGSKLKRVATGINASRSRAQEEELGSPENVTFRTRFNMLQRSLTRIFCLADGCHGFGAKSKTRKNSRGTRRASVGRSRSLQRSGLSSSSLGGKAIRYKPRGDGKDYWKRELNMASPSTSPKGGESEEARKFRR